MQNGRLHYPVERRRTKSPTAVPASHSIRPLTISFITTFFPFGTRKRYVCGSPASSLALNNKRRSGSSEQLNHILIGLYIYNTDTTNDQRSAEEFRGTVRHEIMATSSTDHQTCSKMIQEIGLADASTYLTRFGSASLHVPS